MKNPLLSVIVPVYNVEEFLEQCLDSLVNQSLDDIEIIVVNDGSKDNSQSIIDDFAARYPEKIKPFTKINGGLSDARNYGMDRASGEYLAFVDSDDYVDPDMFKRLYEKSVEDNADIVICDMWNVSTKKQTYHRVVGSTEYGLSIHENPEILRYASSYACNKLYKRSLFTENGIRFPKQLFEDSAVIYNVIASAERISVVKDALYFYRVGRDGAITKTFDKRIYDIFKSCESIISYFKSKKLLSKFSDEVEYLCIMHISARLTALRNNMDLSFNLKFTDAAFDFLDSNFPDWRNNPYYIQVKDKRLMSNKADNFSKRRNGRSELKFYYIMHHFMLRFKRIKSFFKRIKKSIKRWIKNKKNPMTPEEKELAAALKAEEKARKAAEKAEKAAEDVKMLQRYEIGIMKIVHDFCEEHGLRYFLVEGTLLGAVRHQGFIPWDDDIDIGMPREDYDKFIELWNTQIIENCALLYSGSYKKYYLPFVKVVLLDDTGFYNNTKYLPEKFQGPYIDIFPLDKCIQPDRRELINHCGEIRYNRDLLLYKIKYIKKADKRRRLFLDASFNSYAGLHRKLYSLFTEYKDSSAGYIGNFCSSYAITKEAFPEEYFAEPIPAKFEEYTFNIPAHADVVLSTIYGDFMTPPPPEKQVCRHSFKVDREKIEQLKK